MFKPLRALLSSTLFLAVVYLWGYAYHYADLAAFGFNPDLFPLTTQATYVAAYSASLVVIRSPLDWCARTWDEPWTPILALAFVLLVIVAAIFTTRRWAKRWGKRLEAKWALAESRGAREVFRRAIRWLGASCLAVFGFPTLMILFAMINVLLLAFPILTADARARDEWVHRSFLQWPAVTWTDDAGKPNRGNLKTCSAQWCAIVQDGAAITVPATAVKRIENTIPLAASASNARPN